MRRSFMTDIITDIVTGIAGGILFFAILAGPALIGDVRADDYHNPAVAGAESPSYWLDRGALLATYGNYPAAIKAYNKALALDSGVSAIYFNLALAYGETGAFEQARAAINRAVTMAPEDGRYLYGRGWILLQAYGPAQARADFEKAAELGNPDALGYLQGRGLKPALGP